MQPLTLTTLKQQASHFVLELSRTPIPELYGVTDGKAVGTYVEHTFHTYLRQNFKYDAGSSASGIDFPSLELDIKVTSIRQPQSSCPFQSAEQKVYGLGYHLLVFAYDKIDDPQAEVARLNIQHAVFIHKDYTGDYQTTTSLLDILSRNANIDDIIALFLERNLPLDDIGREKLAGQVLSHPPYPGCLTISNALQWRLQYRRAIALAESGDTLGVESLL